MTVWTRYDFGLQQRRLRVSRIDDVIQETNVELQYAVVEELYRRYLFGDWAGRLPPPETLEDQALLIGLNYDYCIFHRRHPKFGPNVLECANNWEEHLFAFFDYAALAAAIAALDAGRPVSPVRAHHAVPADRHDVQHGWHLWDDPEAGGTEPPPDGASWTRADFEPREMTPGFSNVALAIRGGEWPGFHVRVLARLYERYFLGDWARRLPPPEALADGGALLPDGGTYCIFHRRHPKFGPNVIEAGDRGRPDRFCFFDHASLPAVFAGLDEGGAWPRAAHVPLHHAQPEDRRYPGGAPGG